MGVKKLEVRVVPAGSTAGNLLACGPGGMRGLCVWTPG